MATTMPDITVTLDMLTMRECEHCDTETVQVGEPTPYGPEMPPGTNFHCLQCMADGGDCCDLAEFTRHGEQ